MHTTKYNLLWCLIHSSYSITMQFLSHPFQGSCLQEEVELTLSVHRRVEAIKPLIGHPIVRVTLADCTIDIHVPLSTAQEFWLKALQRPVPKKSSPVLQRRRSVTHMGADVVKSLVERSDSESFTSSSHGGRSSLHGGARRERGSLLLEKASPDFAMDMLDRSMQRISEL